MNINLRKGRRNYFLYSKRGLVYYLFCAAKLFCALYAAVTSHSIFIGVSKKYFKYCFEYKRLSSNIVSRAHGHIVN